MTATYDLTTEVGHVRLLIPDRDLTVPVFQDEELQVFLDLEGDVRRAAAMALETIAADDAKTLRITTVLGLSVNGVAASQAVMARAKALREQAAEAEAREEALFDWAEIVVDEFTAAERLEAEILREQVP